MYIKLSRILFFVAIVLTQNAFSQFKGKAIYELVVAEEDGKPSRTENYIVYFDGQRSIEFIQNANFDRSAKNENEVVEIKTIKLSAGKKFLYKDFKSNKLIIHTGIMFKNYLVNDTLSNFKWRITKERKRILNYNCMKATTEFRGRNYEAWFTEDVPIQNGPWKFCGLPGLIVTINDEKELFKYKLSGVDFKTKFESSILDYPNLYAKSKAISYKSFMELYKRKLDENAKLSKVVETSKNGSHGSVTIILPQNMEKF